MITLKSKQLSEKFEMWWHMSRKGNLPIYHPADLDRFAELVKESVDKQDELNATVLYEFLRQQLDEGKLKKGEEDKIDTVIALYEFGVNNLSKFFG